jgi:hypothetical protein
MRQNSQARLDGQSRDNDALDVKALGVVAVDAAIFALLAIVHHDSLNRFWAVPAAAIILGGLLLVASVFRQAVDAGPNWRTFFEQFGGLAPEALALQMLSDLLTAIFVERRARALERPPLRGWLPYQRRRSDRSRVYPLLPLTSERSPCPSQRLSHPPRGLVRRLRRCRSRRPPMSSSRRAQAQAPKSARPVSPRSIDR